MKKQIALLITVIMVFGFMTLLIISGCGDDKVIIEDTEQQTEEESIAGTYVNKTQQSKIILKPEGDFILRFEFDPNDPQDTFGTYTVTGDVIELDYGNATDVVSINGNKLVFNDGTTFVKSE